MSQFYAVAIGRKPGIYMSINEAKRQTQKFPCALMKPFNSLRKAQTFLETKYIYVVKKGRKVGLFYNMLEFAEQVTGYPNAQFEVFTNLNQAMKYLNQSDKPEPTGVYAIRKGRKVGLFSKAKDFQTLTKGYPGAEGKFFPTEREAIQYLRQKTPKVSKEPSCYYAVKVGHQTGIFTSYDLFQKHMAGYKGSEGKKFKTREAAETYLKEQPLHITLYVVKRGHQTGIFKTNKEFQQATLYFKGPEWKKCSSYEEANRYLQEEMDNGTFYAVRQGHKVGIFTSPEDFVKQIRGFKNAEGRKFKSRKLAEEYLKDRPNFKQTIFAVKVGRSPGIYHDYDECVAQTKGIPYSEFKKFNSLQKAQEYIDSPCDYEFKMSVSQQLESTNEWSSQENAIVAYSDGSFNENKPTRYGYGVVFIKNNQVIKELNGYGVKYKTHHSMAAELVSIMKTIEYATKQGYLDLYILHDCSYPNNAEQVKKNGAEYIYKDYNHFLDKFKKKINIHFRQIKGHNGNKFNVQADKLAKQAIGIQKVNPEELLK